MNSKYIARRFIDATSSLSLDTKALSLYDDIIDLSIGDTDLVTDRSIIEAAFNDACLGYTRYGNPKGDPELIKAICNAWEEDYGQAVSEDQVLITASSCLGMALTLMAILNPGDEVLVFSPYFSPYLQQIRLAGGVPVEIPTFAEDGFAIRKNVLDAAITPRTKAIIFNNPCNPTGVFYGEETLELLAHTAISHDLLVIADEIYTGYVFEEKFIPIRTLPEMSERTVTLNSFSKNFLMTGWRVGYIIAEPFLLQTVQHINDAMIYTTPSISQRAALKALSVRKQVIAENVSEYRNRIYYAADRIDQLQYLNLVRPRGTFYLFPKIKDNSISSSEFCALLLEKAHILVSPGHIFGSTGAGHIRIACTKPLSVLKEAFERMETLSL